MYCSTSRPHLALVAGQHEDLVPRGFDRPGLVDVDMPRIGRQHPFVTPQQSVDDRGVGLGAADQEVHLGLRNSAGLADEFPGVFRMGIAAVPRTLLEIGLGEAAHHFGMRPFHVVAVEM